MNSRLTRAALTGFIVSAFSINAKAQGLDLTINHVGLAIGDVPEVTGLRLNYRDRNLRRVDGVNVTIWDPYRDARSSVVRGVALGLPLTGAGRIDGLALGLLGAGATERMRGVGIGGIGIGSGGNMTGLFVGGIGVGTGGNFEGIAVGGIGAGAGGNVRGLTISLIGAGAGGNVRGITLAGIGAGAGGNVTGITVAGIAAGAGGNSTGINIAGIASGAGGDVTGLTIAGIATGAGRTLTGLAVAGIAAGAPRIRGVTLAGVASGGEDIRGVVIAGAWMRVERGEIRGVSVSSFNQVKGVQRGLAIGIVNFAEELHGAQIGLINIARNNPSGRRVLPVINWHRD